MLHRTWINVKPCTVSLARRLLSQTVPSKFKPKRVLVLAKFTKYDFEKSLIKDIEDPEKLNQFMLQQGRNVDWLVSRHNAHYSKLLELQKALKSHDIDVHVVNRKEYTAELISWADIIFTAGGDGTFLLGASKVLSRDKLMVGLNTDPDGSHGYLCLPKWCSMDVPKAIDSFLMGNFQRFWRSRIRVTLMHWKDRPPTIETLDKLKATPLDKWPPLESTDIHSNDSETLEGPALNLIPETNRGQMTRTVLPSFALNEVFVGEALSAKVSYYEVSVDGKNALRQKSSGIVVSPGTGSTSWFHHMIRMHPQTVHDILNIAKICISSDSSYRTQSGCLAAVGSVDSVTGKPLLNMSSVPLSDLTDDQFSVSKLAHDVTKVYNDATNFDPEDQRMAYIVRDPLCNNIFSVCNQRGFTRNLQVRSLMLDSHLVMDGGFLFPFEYGSVADFTINPSDSLCCVRNLRQTQ